MKYTVRTLLEKGCFSQRAISKKLRISRKTVKKYFDEFQNGETKDPQIIKKKKLDLFKEDIKEWLSQGLSGILILEKLKKDKGLKISYPTVSRFVKQFKTSEVYIPLICKPAQEAQVDFGYLGRFFKEDKLVKVWCFSMVLSHSRYAYHMLVTDQSLSTFINCHIEAFEYFGGVPKIVKIDNLKAGVIAPDFYEPTIQRQYAEFLEHYKSAPITARIRRGQDKGKVESGVKYVKNNFLKRIEPHKDFYELKQDLLHWTNEVSNLRLHGTTRKIPYTVFVSSEKKELTPLPSLRYDLYNIENRKVNNYGHISFKYNFYSVPYHYIGKTLIIKSNTCLLKVYDGLDQVALHAISQKQGEFISKDEHRPPEKQRKTQQLYTEKAIEFGDYTHRFLEKLIEQKPYHWHRIIQGVFNLEKNYDIAIINKACRRALEYNVIGYNSVKSICKNNLYDKQPESLSVYQAKGFAHNLKDYDQLLNNNNLN